jgi:hypothetical protein
MGMVSKLQPEFSTTRFTAQILCPHREPAAATIPFLGKRG